MGKHTQAGGEDQRRPLRVSSDPVHPTALTRESPWIWLWPCFILIAGAIVYANSFRVPFLFDDQPFILFNPRVRHLWPIWDALRPPPQSSSAGPSRPLVNVSLAINYAMSGRQPWSYHATNLAIHVLAGWLLFGVVRRTLMTDRLRPRYGVVASTLAGCAALVWTVHPLQTQAVTYLIQRGESLTGLWYLLTIYAFLRSTASIHRRRWIGVAWAACAAGMATKPVMVTAPLMALVLDRVLLADSWRTVWRQRGGVYVGLALTWIILAAIIGTAPRSAQPTAGFGLASMSPLAYARTQPSVILHYLRLALWPDPLVFDYSWPVAKTPVEILVPLAGLGLLLAGVAWLLRRNAAMGCWGLWVFVILAPSSSVIPIADLAFEHRMYLPLAGVVTLVVIAAEGLLRRLFARDWMRRFAAGSCLAVWVLGLGVLTIRRNAAYQSEETIWRDTILKRPQNARAHSNLGVILAEQGRYDEAKQHYLESLKASPDYAHGHNNLGTILAKEGQYAEAIREYQRAGQLDPYFPNPSNNTGLALAAQGRYAEAMPYYQHALELNPRSSEFHCNLGVALTETHQLKDATQHFLASLELDPDNARAHNNLGDAYLKQGKPELATREFVEALRLQPDYADAENNLGVMLVQEGRVADAQAHFAHALRGQASAEGHYNLARALLQQGRVDESLEHFREALRLKPEWADVRNHCGTVLAQHGRLDEAAQQFTELLRRDPRHAEGHNNLANVLLQQGRTVEALTHYQQALDSNPRYAQAHFNLGLVLAGQGRAADAIPHVREVLRLTPDWPEAHKVLATLLIDQGQFDDARTHLAEAIRLKPDDAEAQAQLRALDLKTGSHP